VNCAQGLRQRTDGALAFRRIELRPGLHEVVAGRARLDHPFSPPDHAVRQDVRAGDLRQRPEHLGLMAQRMLESPGGDADHVGAARP
jgi:hypothetical protein